VDNKSSQANEWEKQTDILRREISDKSHKLHDSDLMLSRVQKVKLMFIIIPHLHTKQYYFNLTSPGHFFPLKAWGETVY